MAWSIWRCEKCDCANHPWNKKCIACSWPKGGGKPKRVPSELDAFQAEVGAWTDTTCPGSTLETMLDHLRYEVDEEATTDNVPEALTDAFLVILHMAHRKGVSMWDLARAGYEEVSGQKFAVPQTGEE